MIWRFGYTVWALMSSLWEEDDPVKALTLYPTVPVAFGQLTVLNPALTHRLKSEMDRLADDKGTGYDPAVMNAIRVLRQDYPKDDNISWAGFAIQRGVNGQYPNLALHARAGLFPLKAGWSLIASNNGKVTLGSDARFPEADLNHLMRMLRDSANAQRPAEDVVSDYLTNEKALHQKRAHAPIAQLEINYLA